MPAESEPSATFMNPRFLPWVLISELYWMSYKLLERRFYHLDCGAAQARILCVIYYATGPMKPSVLATLLFQETQGVTAILQRMEAKGWISRSPDPKDGRSVDLALTPPGRKLTKELIEISRELYDELFAPALNGRDVDQLRTALRKVRAVGFTMPETTAKLRRGQQYGLWSD